MNDPRIPINLADGAAVPSPCINVCRLDVASGWCEGCARTLDEIAAWSVMSDDAKRAVWARLPGRHEQLARARVAAPDAAPPHTD
jgi:uncharacterized protein